VTIASDAAYNKSLQTIMQHLTSQEAVYGTNAIEEIALIKRLLVSGDASHRSEALAALLRWCCSADDDDALARMAFEAGADPNLGCEYLGPPLHVACTHVCPRIAKLLLAAQAHPNTMVPYLPKGKVGGAVKRTALDIAIATASPEMIQILLEAGADFNAVRIHGGLTYDAMQVHRTQSALDMTVARPTPSSQTLSPNLQVVRGQINSNTETKHAPDLQLCLKKVEYAVKRGERERLRWGCSKCYLHRGYGYCMC